MFLTSGLITIWSLIKPAPPLYVAYVERESSGQVVYFARADGSEARTLTPHFQISWSPTWSPDGRRIVVLSADNLENIQLSIIELSDIRTKQNLYVTFPSKHHYFLSPAWSPDGDWIAFSGYENGVHSIFRVNVDNRHIEQLTDLEGNDFRPAWSPDGQWLVFASDRDHQQGSDLYRIRINDTHAPPERLTFTPDRRKTSLQWSPDGRLLAFIADHGHTRRVLYTLNVTTGQIKEVTEVYPPIEDWQLNWSGDGAWLHVLKERNGEPAWYRIYPDGESLEPLPEMEGLYNPAWSPVKERSRARLHIALIVCITTCGTLLLLNTHLASRRLLLKQAHKNEAKKNAPSDQWLPSAFEEF